MQQNYKERQQHFHENQATDDWLDNLKYTVDDSNVVDEIIKYFTVPIDHLTFPAKTYAVAIIYALLIERYFGVSFVYSLCDPTLLFNNDRFFKTYQEDPLTYQSVFDHLGNTPYLDERLPQIRATIDYFKKEFYLYENPYFVNTTSS